MKPAILDKFSSGTYQISIPLLLLRGQYINTSKWNKLKFILCDFDETIKCIADKQIKIQTSMINWQERDVYGFNKETVLDIVMKGEDEIAKNYTAFIALLYRLTLAHRQMKKAQMRKDKATTFRFQLYIDMHIDIANYIETNSVFTDDNLLDEQISSPVKNLYPDEARISYCGELPDITACIDAGNLWYDVRSKDKSMVACIVHLIICKIQNQKCQIRNFVSILYEYYKQYPCILSLFKSFLEVSMLGNYPHCTFRPEFRKRMKIRSSFHGSNISDHQMILWMHENEHTVYYCTKEYYMYAVDQQYILESILLETKNWIQVKEYIIKATEITRILLSQFEDLTEHDAKGKDLFQVIESEVSSIHKKGLKYISKLRKSHFIPVILNVMKKHHEHKIINQKSTKDQKSENYLSKEVLESIDFVSKSSRNKEGTVELSWLKCLGISEGGYNMIRNLYFKYETNRIADNAITRYISQIHSNRKEDFHLIRVYLSYLQSNRRIKSFKLSADYYKNQLEALREKYCIPPWEQLPEEADLYYYCEVCQKWASPVVEYGPKKLYTNIYARGTMNSLYDMENDQMYCEKQITSNVIKKYMESGDYEDREDMDNKKKARAIRKHKETSGWHNTPLKAVHMLGRCQEVNQKLWALCEVCAQIIQFEGVRFGKQGFTCGMHRKDMTEPLSSKQNEQMKDRECPLFKARCEFEVILKRRPERCVYCDLDQESVKDGLVPIRLIKEDKGKYLFELEYLCSTDYNHVFQLFENNATPTRATVISTISKTKEHWLYSKHKIVSS